MKLAQAFPQRYDLHETHRLLTGLDAYEHLRRVFRLCTVHVARNIKEAKVSDSVKVLMRSLVCINHPNFDGTLSTIRNDGGKSGYGEYFITLIRPLDVELNIYLDWVHDKIRSKFALPGICWEKSFIPIDIWRAGDNTSNIIESLHFDVNCEGKNCTLVGGLQRGQRFDMLKIRTLQVSGSRN